MSDESARPQDPAGSRPRHDPDSLLPETTNLELISDENAQEKSHEPRGLGSTTQQSKINSLPHNNRFQLLFGALSAIALIALVLLFALATSPYSNWEKTTTNFSRWKPSGDGVVEQVAKHIGPLYRNEKGQQLVKVDGGPLTIANIPLDIVIRQPASRGGNFETVSGRSALYRLCGLGKNCAIASGKPSVARHQLLRRQSLELALLTFAYSNDLDNVVIFLPPPPGKTADQALFYRRSDLAEELSRPLAMTLSSQTPTVGKIAKSADAPITDLLTLPHLYTFSLSQANQENKIYLVLDPALVAQDKTDQKKAKPKTSSKPR